MLDGVYEKGKDLPCIQCPGRDRKKGKNKRKKGLFLRKLNKRKKITGTGGKGQKKIKSAFVILPKNGGKPAAADRQGSKKWQKEQF